MQVFVDVPDEMLSLEMQAVVAAYRQETEALEREYELDALPLRFVLPETGDAREAFTKAGMLALTLWQREPVARLGDRLQAVAREHLYVVRAWPEGQSTDVVDHPTGPRELVRLDALAAERGYPREQVLAIPTDVMARVWDLDPEEVRAFAEREQAEDAAWEQLPPQWYAFLAYEEAMGREPGVRTLLTTDGPQVCIDGPTAKRFADWVGGPRAGELKQVVDAISARPSGD
jgi:hypothetical protein